MIDFSDQAVVVTGAGRGLGREYALELGRRGAGVVVNDLGGSMSGEGADQSVAEAVAEEIRTGGGRAVASHDSVDDPDGARAIVARATDEFGRLDAVVSNAGIYGMHAFGDLTVEQWLPELRRAITELGFVGAMVNSDPYEGTEVPPAMGERYWYPLYETLCELDVPMLLHSAGCKFPAREPYSLHFIQEETVSVWSMIQANVFADFPDLKVIVAHGGGAIPYQMGRFLPSVVRTGVSYLDKLRNFYFDSCLYTQDSLELLMKAVGTDRVLFGSEKPGTGSQIDPETGRWFDDIHLLIDDIEWLDADRRADVLENNARSLFRL